MATGLEMLGLVSHPEGDHAYPVPPLALRVVDLFRHIEISTPALTKGMELTNTLTESLLLHPLESVTITV